jgi:hypothetical protein
MKLKKMKQIKIFALFVIIICTALPLGSFAQGPPDPEDTPIDGGLSLLLAAGAAYGVKKYRDGRKKQEEEKES